MQYRPNKATKLKDAVVRQKVTIPLADGAIVGEFFTFKNLSDSAEHIAIGFGNWRAQQKPLVRLHSECLTGDLFQSAKCDCGAQLKEAVSRFSREGGLLLYLRQEGRGIGLYNKLDAYALQAMGFNTYQANRMLSFKDDERSYQAAAQMLLALNVKRIRLLSNNPDKAAQLMAAGVEVTEVNSTGVYENRHNRKYLEAKIEHTGHHIHFTENV